MGERKVSLVIGGGGFLGQHIVQSLLDYKQRGELQIDKIRIFDIQYRPQGLIEDPCVEYVKGNICLIDDLIQACKGVDTIYHTASPPEGRPRELYMKVNVEGTRNLIEAAKKNNVKYFVYTSTASVVFDGKDITNIDETTPYVTKYLDPYIETKIMAEKIVIEANNGDDFLTVALRPSGIFGAHDAQAWPGLIEAGKKGQSKFQLGFGKNLMDWTYVENLSDAHCLAALRLQQRPDLIGGQAFFITNGEPIPFWDMGKFIWTRLGYPTPKIFIPAFLIIFIAIILDFVVMLLKPIKEIKPSITYFRAVLATRNRTFSIAKAEKLLEYKPKISLKEGMEITLKSFEHERNPKAKKID